jgi:translation initiation factor 1 (eIF-1/SUI1)
MSVNKTMSAFRKQQEYSDSGESDSEDETTVISTHSNVINSVTVTNTAVGPNAIKPKNSFFRSSTDPDSDSESEFGSDGDSDSSKKSSGSCSGKNVSGANFESEQINSVSNSVPNGSVTMTRKALKHKEKLARKAKESAAAAAAVTDDLEASSGSLSVFEKMQVPNGMADTDFVRVHIRNVQRNSRKSVTTIEGIPKEFFENKSKLLKFMNKLQKAIATRATHKVDEATGQNIIETSGNKAAIMAKIICEEVECGPGDIVLHGVSA